MAGLSVSHSLSLSKEGNEFRYKFKFNSPAD
jgi:hypothetical protein